MPYVVFDVERILERSDLDSAEGKDRAIAELREPFARLGQSVLRDDLLRRSAGAMALSEGRLATLLADGRSSTGVDGRGSGRVWPDPGQTAAAAGQSAASATQRATASGHGVRHERSFLAMCVAAPAPGELALAAIDADVHLTGGVLRRAARHLSGRLSQPMTGLAPDDEELAKVVADLVARAGAGPGVGPDQLEHARYLLELAHVDRELSRATASGAPPGVVVELARRRQDTREAIGRVVSRIERAS